MKPVKEPFKFEIGERVISSYSQETGYVTRKYHIFSSCNDRYMKLYDLDSDHNLSVNHESMLSLYKPADIWPNLITKRIINKG